MRTKKNSATKFYNLRDQSVYTAGGYKTIYRKANNRVESAPVPQ